MIFFWIILYGLVFCLSEQAASRLPESQWTVPLAMLVYTLLLLRWIHRSGQQDHAGLSTPRFSGGAALFFLPLGILPLCNLLFTGAAPVSGPVLILTLCTCTAEELFFRGFLLSFLRQIRFPRYCLAAAAAFALFHCGTLFTGASLGYVCTQVLLAFSAGLYYGLIRCFCGTLLPCIAAHFFVNITAGNPSPAASSGSMAPWVLCAVMMLICSYLLSQKTAKTQGGLEHHETLY